MPNSHFFEEIHDHHDLKHEKYIEKWKKCIYEIKKSEDGKRFVVIKPSIEGRIKIIGR